MFIILRMYSIAENQYIGALFPSSICIYDMESAYIRMNIIQESMGFVWAPFNDSVHGNMIWA